MAVLCGDHGFAEIAVQLIRRGQVGAYVLIKSIFIVVQQAGVLVHAYIIYDDADKAKRLLGGAGKLQQLLFNTAVGSGGKYFYARVDSKQLGPKGNNISFIPGAYRQVNTFFGKRCCNGPAYPFGGGGNKCCIHDYNVWINVV